MPPYVAKRDPNTDFIIYDYHIKFGFHKKPTYNFVCQILVAELKLLLLGGQHISRDDNVTRGKFL